MTLNRREDLMPYLNFKCQRCNEVFEELVNFGEVEAECPKCGETCARAFEGECNFHVPGSLTGRLRKGTGAPLPGKGE
jgi:putative FmdB family regulatory protein